MARQGPAFPRMVMFVIALAAAGIVLAAAYLFISSPGEVRGPDPAGVTQTAP